MFSQVYEYYNQALQFLDSQGPSYMGSRKAKVRNDHRQAICDEPQCFQLVLGSPEYKPAAMRIFVEFIRIYMYISSI